MFIPPFAYDGDDSDAHSGGGRLGKRKYYGSDVLEKAVLGRTRGRRSGTTMRGGSQSRQNIVNIVATQISIETFRKREGMRSSSHDSVRK